jgi:Holliday junction resolvase
MSNYSRGANFERRVRKHLEQQGWVVFRSAGSHSPADLIALKAGEVMLVQCQLDGYFTRAKKGALQILIEELNCQGCLAWREGKVLSLGIWNEAHKD